MERGEREGDDDDEKREGREMTTREREREGGREGGREGERERERGREGEAGRYDKYM